MHVIELRRPERPSRQQSGQRRRRVARRRVCERRIRRLDVLTRAVCEEHKEARRRSRRMRVELYEVREMRHDRVAGHSGERVRGVAHAGLLLVARRRDAREAELAGNCCWERD